MNKNQLRDYAIDGYKNIESEKTIGIFGNPIKHTLSPIIHNTLSESLGLDESYIPFLVKEDELGECVRMAFDENVLGLNITVPHKETVMRHLVENDEDARIIGAVNTLCRCENGFKGYNTDVLGLAKAIDDMGVSLKDKSIIILGAGGAARATAFMCMKALSKKIFIVNRTYKNACKIADDLNEYNKSELITAIAENDINKIPNDKYIFIQTTSVGLKESDGLPFEASDEFYKMANVGIDLIYNPAKTKFLELVEEVGAKTMNGLKMLQYQGIMSYELWNEVSVSPQQSDLVYNNLSKAIYGKNIILIGFMGSGKTSVGTCLAEKNNYKFIDTDSYIEKRESMSISEIFATKGEAYFRELETKVICELINNAENTVISTGGGMPLLETNQKLLKELGDVYYLEASAKWIYNRIKGDRTRPLLQKDDPKLEIEKLLEERQKQYLNVADFVVNVDGISVPEVIEKITIKHSKN